MRTLFVIVTLLLALTASALAHPHNDCPPADQSCKHTHPDNPKGGPR